VRYRGLDCAISEKYGIRMCCGDTIGPGGIFRAMRELPLIMDCVKDVARLCPQAWVMNYINPSMVNGMAIAHYAPAVKSFALCDSLHMPKVKIRYARRAGIITEQTKWNAHLDAAFDMRIAGVNHFTWMLKAEYEGRDVSPQIAESLRQSAAENTDGNQGAKTLYNDAIAYQLYQIFGHIPTCVAHTKEYVRFYQGHGILKDAIPPLLIWETDMRYARHDAMWQQVDDFISGVLPVGEMPRGLRGLQELVLDTHELTAEAIMKADYGLLRCAMMTDPLTNAIADADAILRALLAAERAALPDHWYQDTVF